MAFGEHSAMQGCVVAEDLIRNAPSKCYPKPASLLTHHPNNYLQKTAITYEKATITYEKATITYKKATITHEKVAITHEKVAITYEKAVITYEKVAITRQSNAIYSPIVDWAVC